MSLVSKICSIRAPFQQLSKWALPRRVVGATYEHAGTNLKASVSACGHRSKHTVAPSSRVLPIAVIVLGASKLLLRSPLVRRRFHTALPWLCPSPGNLWRYFWCFKSKRIRRFLQRVLFGVLQVDGVGFRPVVCRPSSLRVPPSPPAVGCRRAT